MDQLIRQLFELRPRQLGHQVLRHAVDRHDVRQVDFSFSSARQLDFGLFGSLFQPLQSHRVFPQIDMVLRFELAGQPVDDHVVEVVPPEVRIPVGRFHFEDAVAEFEDRDIERPPTEVVNGDLHVLVGLFEPVGQRGCGRFVDNPRHLQACDFARLLSGLPLRVVEVSRHGNHRFRDLLAQVIFGGFLHFLKHHGRNFLRAVQPPVDVNPRHAVFVFHDIRHTTEFVFDLGVGLAHEPFDRKNGPFRVGNRLALSRVADFAFAVFGECHDRRGGAMSLAVRNDDGFVAFHNGNA